ncbi:MAG TPA: nucleotide exchange factor GrpE [Longimicrobium sp.]|nr:nucleotide exchange factor GrpE [Longimicrobium sp.]
MADDKKQATPDAARDEASPADGEAPAGSNGHAGNGLADPGAAPEAAPAGGGGDAGELAALKDRYLRLAAEFENYRKRVERERTEGAVRAQAQLMERFLEPLDDLARIADFDPETTPAGALHEGAEMVERKFLRAMETAGLEAIADAEGKPFDPTLHEALTTVPAESEAEDDTIAQVYQKGYRFKGVLLRPARVVVKKHNG